MSRTSNTLVSVAVVTYQHINFIGECLDSILAQDYRPLEIVVADDGSTDGTQDIVKAYALRNPREFVLRLSSTNRGVTSNCNAAHFACTGKYIAWMAGDDKMYPGKIRKQVDHMEEHPDCSISYHNLDIIDSTSGRKIGRYNTIWNIHTGDVYCLIRYGSFNGACSNMVRREKTPTAGFDNTLPVASDWYYWIEILFNGGTIDYIDEVLGMYRRHSQNVTNKTSAHYFQAILDHISTCEKTVKRDRYLKAPARIQLSNIYRAGRHFSYEKCLKRSILYNRLNLRSLIMLAVYRITGRKWMI